MTLNLQLSATERSLAVKGVRIESPYPSGSAAKSAQTLQADLRLLSRSEHCCPQRGSGEPPLLWRGQRGMDEVSLISAWIQQPTVTPGRLLVTDEFLLRKMFLRHFSEPDQRGGAATVLAYCLPPDDKVMSHGNRQLQLNRQLTPLGLVLLVLIGCLLFSDRWYQH